MAERVRGFVVEFAISFRAPQVYIPATVKREQVSLKFFRKFRHGDGA